MFRGFHSREKGTDMTVAMLLALSAGTGLVLGTSLNWYAIAISSLPLALLCAAVLEIKGFGALSGIAIVVGCLTLSQVAYVIMGVTLAYIGSGGEPDEKAVRAGGLANSN
jgi:hypothetical protein